MRVLSLIGVCLVGCASPEPQQKASGRTPMVFYDDPERMRDEIMRIVPVGTPANVAQKLMEDDGFECRLMAEGQAGQHLYCSARRDWKAPVVRVWHVTLWYGRSGVTDARVSTGLVGP